MNDVNGHLTRRVPDERLADFIRGLPKAELHLHIEGTLEPELMFSLAARNGVRLPYADIDAVRRAYAFSDLQSFLDIYYAGSEVLLREQDFYDMAWAYLLRAQADNVIHAELFFDPQTHTARGVPMRTVIDGLSRAVRDAGTRLGISAALILCFLRHLSEDEAFDTLEQAMPFREHFIGVGLDSSELGHPPEKFRNVFACCRAEGLHVTVHAGEEGPPEYIWQALDLLEAERIDHGVRCLEDAELVTELAQRRVPLTVCPLSNWKLQGVPTLRQHPLKRLLQAGLMVTVNSDDPAYFGGYVNQNFIQVFDALALDAEAAVRMAANSINAAFVGVEQKEAMLLRLRNYIEAFE